MYVKIQNSGKGGNSGSSSAYVSYLEKENDHKPENEKEHFFSHENDNVKAFEVVDSIDNNRKKLGKDEAKFYSVTISPSKEELKHIGNDKNILKSFTRAAMDKYADNFNRGIKGKDLVYYAKIENERKGKGELNTHVHVIVSRKDKTQRLKLSPLANTKNKKVMFQGKEIQKGFDRANYCNEVENVFDKGTKYDRSLEDSFTYKLEQKNLSISEKLDNILNPKEVEQNLIQEVEPIKEEEKLKEQKQNRFKARDKGM